MMMPVLPLLSTLLLAAVPAIHVVGVDDGATCAPALEEALRSRLPGLRVERQGELGPGDLEAELGRAADAWLLQVRDGEKVALHRELRLAERECALAAETGALIVDRFLEEVRWPGRPVSIEPLPRRPAPPPPPAAPPPPPPSPEPPLIVAQPAYAAPQPAPARSRFAIALGPAAWLGAPSDLRAAALFSASLQASDQVQLSLLALAGAASSEAVLIAQSPRGATKVQAALLAAEAAACAEALGLRLCIGPLAGARGSLGSSSGGLFQQSSALLIQPEVGLHAAAGLRLSSSLELALDLIGAAALGSASFAIAGEPSAARTLPTLDLAAALRLVWGPL